MDFLGHFSSKSQILLVPGNCPPPPPLSGLWKIRVWSLKPERTRFSATSDSFEFWSCDNVGASENVFFFFQPKN